MGAIICTSNLCAKGHWPNTSNHGHVFNVAQLPVPPSVSCNATASRHNGYGPCRLSSASVVVVDQRREQAEGALMATGLY